MKTNLGVTIILILWTSNVFAQGGAMGGGGGDNPAPERDSAWFLGAGKTIQYCIEWSPDFGLDLKTAQSEIQTAFQTWDDYVAKREIFKRRPEEQMVTKGKRIEKCDGSEDLKFYLGVNNSETTEGKKAYDNPSAFALRTSYSIEAGWGKGYAWFAPHGTVFVYNSGGDGLGSFPNWSDVNTFRAMALHEIGHILGCGHVKGTIMTNEINWLIQNHSYPLDKTQEQRTKIDHDMELVSQLGSGEEKYISTYNPQMPDSGYTLNDYNRNLNLSNLKSLFSLVSNQESRGIIYATLIRPASGARNGTLNAKQPYEWNELRIKDQNTELVLEINSFSHEQLIWSEQKIFKTRDTTVHRQSSSQSGGFREEHAASIVQFTDTTGKTYMGEILRNMGGSPVVLNVFGKYGPITILFRTDLGL